MFYQWNTAERTNSSETLDLSTASLLVDTATVSLLTVLKRGVDVNVEDGSSTSTSVGLNILEGLFAGRFERRNRSSDDSCTGFRQLGGDESNTLNVLVAIFFGESELCKWAISIS